MKCLAKNSSKFIYIYIYISDGKTAGTFSPVDRRNGNRELQRPLGYRFRRLGGATPARLSHSERRAFRVPKLVDTIRKRKWFVCTVNRPKRVALNDRSPADIACHSPLVSPPETALILEIVPARGVEGHPEGRERHPKHRPATVIYG